MKNDTIVKPTVGAEITRAAEEIAALATITPDALRGGPATLAAVYSVKAGTFAWRTAEGDQPMLTVDKLPLGTEYDADHLALAFALANALRSIARAEHSLSLELDAGWIEDRVLEYRSRVAEALEKATTLRQVADIVNVDNGRSISWDEIEDACRDVGAEILDGTGPAPWRYARKRCADNSGDWEVVSEAHVPGKTDRLTWRRWPADHYELWSDSERLLAGTGAEVAARYVEEAKDLRPIDIWSTLTVIHAGTVTSAIPGILTGITYATASASAALYPLDRETMLADTTEDPVADAWGQAVAYATTAATSWQEGRQIAESCENEAEDRAAKDARANLEKQLPRLGYTEIGCGLWEKGDDTFVVSADASRDDEAVRPAMLNLCAGELGARR